MTVASLPDSLRQRAVHAGHGRYQLLRSTYTTIASPEVILVPETSGEAADALNYARDSGLPVSVRSGGHALSGRSSNNGGIVLDLSALNAVDVLDVDERTVRIGAGARWANVTHALAPHGWVISSGDHGNVGVGGLATAGGIGWFARSSGLTIDHVRAVDVLLADGTRVRADRTEQPDLYWAMRGAGDSVGIALGFEIEATATGGVGVAQLVVEADRAGDMLRRWSEYTSAAPRELSTAAILMPHQGGVIMQITAVVASADQAVIRRLAGPLTRIGRTLDDVVQLVPYAALMSKHHLHANVGQQPVTVTNGLLPTLTSDSAGAIMDVAAHPSRPIVQLRSLGGAINDVATDATAYAHRHQQVLAIVSQFPPGDGAQLDDVWRSVAPYADGAYRSFESRPNDHTFRLAFPGPTGDRVLDLRNRFDPDGVLHRLAIDQAATDGNPTEALEESR
jgi:hypothetical protein